MNVFAVRLEEGVRYGHTNFTKLQALASGIADFGSYIMLASMSRIRFGKIFVLQLAGSKFHYCD